MRRFAPRLAAPSGCCAGGYPSHMQGNSAPRQICPFLPSSDAAYYTIFHRHQTTATINISHPQNKPITNAYREQPYVATMFRTILRFAIIDTSHSHIPRCLQPHRANLRLNIIVSLIFHQIFAPPLEHHHLTGKFSGAL